MHHFSSLYRPFGLCIYLKKVIREFHSLQQFKQKKFVQRTSRKLGKSVKEGNRAADKEPKVYMRSTIDKISKILRFSTWDSAQEQLEKLPLRWDSYTINQTLKTHPPMEKAWLFFNWASHLKGFKHDQFTYTTMLDIFGEAGRLSSMKYVFEKMKEKGVKIDVVTYTSLLHWLAKGGDFEGSLKIWEQMRDDGLNPTVVSYTAFMKVLLDNNRLKFACEVYKEMIESGCPPNCHTYTVLIEYLAGAGKFKEALEILSKMQETGVQPDKATCNILVQKCARAGEMVAMALTLKYMKEKLLVLRRSIYLEALDALKVARESDDLLREVNPHLSRNDSREGISDDEADTADSMDRALVLMLLGKKNFVAIERLFDGFICKKNTHLDSELVTAVICTTCANNQLSGSLLALEYSIKMGVRLEKAAYLTLIGHFIRIKSFQKVVEIIQKMLESEITVGTYLISQLIYKLGCIGLSDYAATVFDSVHDERNVATYTALIGAYIQSGNVEKGLELSTRMAAEGISASCGTLEILIVGLEEAGRIQDADSYRKKQRDLQRNAYLQPTISTAEHVSNLLFFDRGRMV